MVLLARYASETQRTHPVRPAVFSAPAVNAVPALVWNCPVTASNMPTVPSASTAGT